MAAQYVRKFHPQNIQTQARPGAHIRSQELEYVQTHTCAMYILHTWLHTECTLVEPFLSVCGCVCVWIKRMGSTIVRCFCLFFGVLYVEWRKMWRYSRKLFANSAPLLLHHMRTYILMYMHESLSRIQRSHLHGVTKCSRAWYCILHYTKLYGAI